MEQRIFLSPHRALHAAFPAEAVANLDGRIAKAGVRWPTRISSPEELGVCLRGIDFFAQDFVKFNLQTNDKLVSAGPEVLELMTTEVFTHERYVAIFLPRLFAEFSTDGKTVSSDQLRFGVLAYRSSAAKVVALHYLDFSRRVAAPNATLTADQTKELLAEGLRRQTEEGLCMGSLLYQLQHSDLWHGTSFPAAFSGHMEKCASLLTRAMESDFYPLFLQLKRTPPNDPSVPLNDATTTLEEYVCACASPGNSATWTALVDRVCLHANHEFETKIKDVIRAYYSSTHHACFEKKIK